MESTEKRWYVLHTYSGYENRVKSNLESRAQSMGMQDYIFRVVVPEEKVRQVKDGEAKEIEEKTTKSRDAVKIALERMGYTW